MSIPLDSLGAAEALKKALANGPPPSGAYDNKGGAIARFAEVADRTAAEQLRGTALAVSRENLPALDEGEFYFSDLLDLAVVTDTGEAVGRVCAVENFGATDIVEIEKPDGKKFMAPLTAQAVPRWDASQLVINPDFIG